MKQWILASAGLMALTLFASPKATWVPAEADGVLVARRTSNLADYTAYTEAYAAITHLFYPQVLSSDTEKSALQAQLAPWVDLGIIKIEDGYPVENPEAIDSITLSMQLSNVDKGRLFAFIESNVLTQEKVTAAFKAWDAQHDDITLTITQKDKWTLLRTFVADQISTYAYRSEQGVFILTSEKTTAIADALFAGTHPTIASDDPLMAAFAPLPETQVSNTTLIVKNVNTIVKTVTPPEIYRQNIAEQPWGAITQLKLESYGLKQEHTAKALLTATFANDAAAQTMKEAVAGFKFLALVGMTNLDLPPNGAIGKSLVALLTPTSLQKDVTFTLTLTPALLQDLINEVIKLYATALLHEEPTPAAPSSGEDSFIEITPDDEDRFENMTPEEAIRILDAE